MHSTLYIHILYCSRNNSLK